MKHAADVGKNSYFIFFLHMQIGIGFAAKLFNLPFLASKEPLQLLAKPIFIIEITYIFAVIAIRVAKIIKRENDLWLIGIHL